MSMPIMPPLPIRGFAAPLLRPLPTIFTYARRAPVAGYDGLAASRQIFTAHLRAFQAMLVSLARRAGLPDEATRQMITRCRSLAQADSWDMAEALTGFNKDLLLLQRKYGSLLKEAAMRRKGRLGHLFRDETGPCRVLTVHSDQTGPLAEKLDRTLDEGCWYHHEICHEGLASGRLGAADVVLFLAGESPIRPDLEKEVTEANKPLLVLAGGDLIGERDNMAALRTEHHYRDRGRTVLSGPLAAIRLYQAIDGCRVGALLDQESLSSGRAVAINA